MNKDQIMNTLRKEVERSGAVDVGPGVEQVFASTRRRFLYVLGYMIGEGYHIENIKYKHLGTGRKVTLSILVKD